MAISQKMKILKELNFCVFYIVFFNLGENPRFLESTLDKKKLSQA